MAVQLDHRTHVPIPRKPRLRLGMRRARERIAWARSVEIDPLLAVALVLAIGVRIFFWAYTHRVWEDALITITHAQNAVAGHGLVHHLGEGRVQGFTSALSVLVPLIGEFLSHGSGLLALR